MAKWLAAVAAAPAATAAFSESEWPANSVRVVVPYPAGGSVDLAARVVFERVGRDLGRVFIIDNKPGGNGAIGVSMVARSRPDGYTLALAADATTFHPLVEENPQFLITRDFIPVSLFAEQPLVIATSRKSGIKSIAALVAAAKASPGKLAFGVTGTGTMLHVAAEAFFEAAGIKLTHVPYKGGSQSVTDLVAGTIPVAVLGPGPLLPFARTGDVNLLAVTSKARSSSLPDVPSLGETGYPQVNITQWIGLYAPAGTPAAIIGKLADTTNSALHLPALKQRLNQNGIDPVGAAGEELGRRQVADGQRWLQTVKRLNIQIS